MSVRGDLWPGVANQSRDSISYHFGSILGLFWKVGSSGPPLFNYNWGFYNPSCLRCRELLFVVLPAYHWGSWFGASCIAKCVRYQLSPQESHPLPLGFLTWPYYRNHESAPARLGACLPMFGTAFSSSFRIASETSTMSARLPQMLLQETRPLSKWCERSRSPDFWAYEVFELL